MPGGANNELLEWDNSTSKKEREHRCATNMKQICNKKRTNIQLIWNKYPSSKHKYNLDRLEKVKRAMGRDDTACPPNLASSICSCSAGNTNTYLFVGEIHTYLSGKYKSICRTNTNTLFVWMNAIIFACWQGKVCLFIVE